MAHNSSGAVKMVVIEPHVSTIDFNEIDVLNAAVTQEPAVFESNGDVSVNGAVESRDNGNSESLNTASKNTKNDSFGIKTDSVGNLLRMILQLIKKKEEEKIN